MAHLEPRRKDMLTGAIAIVLLTAVSTVAVKGAFGAFDDGYELVGRFDAAGQGLLPESDVKVRGVDIGEVTSIELVDGQAEVRLRIEEGERLPVDTMAVIRPKTLFGEKYVDIVPGPKEQTGPYLEDGDSFAETQGGFELERVLADTYPLLQAIDPAELTTVLGELADAGDGLGETINRSIVNGAELADLFAANSDEARRFLAAFAEVSDQLASDADDLLAIADAGNAVLPTLNAGEGDVVELLRQAGRLSNDVADLLLANKPFVDAAMVDGSRGLQALYDQRDQVIPLVVGLRQYLQSLGSIIRIDAGDGTLMAAVKGILAGETCHLLECLGTHPSEPAAAPPPSTPPPLLPELPELPGLDDLPLIPDLGTSSDGDSGGSLRSLMEKVLGG